VSAGGSSGLLPLLYTFRRCPYAIRARLAIAVSGVAVEQLEVSLRDKPAAMLALSPKGTVPVLRLTDGTVLEESLDIMRWALAGGDPENWLQADVSATNDLIATNDGSFKQALDRYKYAERHPEKSRADHRADAETFLTRLDQQLVGQSFLFGNAISLADAAIFPFVRQCAGVDRDWFDRSPYARLRAWLVSWESSVLFERVMRRDR
jgi:glutathione S-transferase